MKLLKKTSLLLAVLICATTLLVTLFACNNKTLTGISVTIPPSKTNYYESEFFDATDMVVTATYSDNTSETVTDFAIGNTNALTESDSFVTVSFTNDKVTKTASINITVVSVNTAVESLLNSMLIHISSNAPGYLAAVFDAAAGTFLTSISAAGISTCELVKLVRLYEKIIKSELNFSNTSVYGNILEFVENFYDTGITNTKISAFLWETIITFYDVTNNVIKGMEISDEDIPKKAYELLDIYQDILALGKTQFVKVFTAFFDLGKLASSNKLLNLVFDKDSQTGRVTKGEFRDLVLAAKTDMLKSLDILNVQEITLIAGFLKTFLPYVVSAKYGGGDSDVNIQNAVISIIEEMTADYSLVRASLIDSLNIVDTSMINALYDAIALSNKNKAAIVFGKIIYAGITAQNGINNENAKIAVVKYIELINVILGPDAEMEYPDGIDDIIDTVKTDAASLASKDYSAKLVGFEENLIVLWVNGLFA